MKSLDPGETIHWRFRCPCCQALGFFLIDYERDQWRFYFPGHREPIDVPRAVVSTHAKQGWGMGELGVGWRAIKDAVLDECERRQAAGWYGPLRQSAGVPR